MRDFTLIEITWLDSVHDSGWHRLSEFDKYEKQLLHKTIGYKVNESKQTIAVCQSYGLHRKDPTIDAVMIIPKKAILKIKKFDR